MERIRIGCSGWNYKHWRELFYPKAVPVRSWFDFYAEHFDTVEINNSFYRLPSPETFEKWREQAPRGFVYAVKASRFLTHIKRLKDPVTGQYKNYKYPEFVNVPFNPATDDYPYPKEAIDMTYDGLHPSDKGYRVIANMLIKELR